MTEAEPKEVRVFWKQEGEACLRVQPVSGSNAIPQGLACLRWITGSGRYIGFGRLNVDEDDDEDMDVDCGLWIVNMDGLRHSYCTRWMNLHVLSIAGVSTSSAGRFRWIGRPREKKKRTTTKG
jgi:hypothetical protein